MKDFDAYGVTYDQRTGNYRFIYRKGETIYCFDFLEKQFGEDQFIAALTNDRSIKERGRIRWITMQGADMYYHKNVGVHFLVLPETENHMIFLRIVNLDQTILEDPKTLHGWSKATFTHKTDLSQFGKETEQEQ